jgi:hypothetical protein
MTSRQSLLASLAHPVKLAARQMFVVVIKDGQNTGLRKDC